MIDWTYTHFRVFMRLLAPHALLYTEMQTVGAVSHNPKRSLQFNPQEHPVALQLGGSDPDALAHCATLAQKEGYDEVNLNLGCPSDKVQSGHFGACLMNEKKTVSACIRAMRHKVSIPVTAKTRIGIDNQDSYAFFSDFVHELIEAGTQKIIVHARKAWLHGLNPKQNRTIPPVHYDYVYRIKQELSSIPVIINGNILSLNEIKEHLRQVDGVMLGRLACDNPFQIACIHQALYPKSPQITRIHLLESYWDYCLEQLIQNVPLSLLIKPLFNLAFGMPGATAWKKKLMLLMQTKDLSLIESLKEYLLDLEKTLVEP